MTPEITKTLIFGSIYSIAVFLFWAASEAVIRRDLRRRAARIKFERDEYEKLWQARILPHGTIRVFCQDGVSAIVPKATDEVRFLGLMGYEPPMLKPYTPKGEKP